MMKRKQKFSIARDEYTAYSWKVNQIAHDFRLEDAWEFPITVNSSSGVTLRTVCGVVMSDMSDRLLIYKITTLLHKTRRLLGKTFGWDRHVNTLSIPGCSENSVMERLKNTSQKNIQHESRTFRLNGINFNIVYDDENEILLELSNNTVHGMLHFCWIPFNENLRKVRMAAYVKCRGTLGKFYMALIKPFRVFFVYPALMHSSLEKWNEFQSQFNRNK